MACTLSRVCPTCSEGRCPWYGPLPGPREQLQSWAPPPKPSPRNTDHRLFCESCSCSTVKKNALERNPVDLVLTGLGPSPVRSDRLADLPAWMLRAPCHPTVMANMAKIGKKKEARPIPHKLQVGPATPHIRPQANPAKRQHLSSVNHAQTPQEQSTYTK